jgi:hypothetical protein
MKPVEKIERLVKKSRYKASPEAYDRALEGFLQAVDSYVKQKSALTEPNIWRTVMKSPITKLAVVAAVIIVVLIGRWPGGPYMTTVAWGEVAKKVEQIKSFVFQHQISVTNVADGTAVQEAETTTYVSSEFGLRQDAYMNGRIIGISYIPLEGTVVTQVMPDMKKYRRVLTSEEHMRKIHHQANPKGMIREFMSFEHTELGRKIIDGVEVEGVEVKDPNFLTNVFESTVGILWVDVKTNLPVRTEIRGITGNGSIETKIIAYDFNWDADPAPDVFEPNIPDDYTLFEK